MRDSFVFYRSFYDAIKELPEEYQAETYRAVFGYALYGDEPKLSGVPLAVFRLIQPQIDANNRRYENGLKGGRKNQTETKQEPNSNQTVTKPKPNRNLTTTKPEPNVNVNVNVNDNVNGNVDGNVNGNGNGDVLPTNQTDPPSDPPPSAFTPPTINEIRMYILERGMKVIAERFFDYYSERNWTTAKGEPMKDWRAAVRYWDKTENQPKQQSKTVAFSETRTNSLDGFVRELNNRGVNK